MHLNYKNLSDKIDTYIWRINLSGGQRQLISLSRIILSNSKVILLDEPTNNLDEVSINRLKILLKKWEEEDKLILISTHDYRLISEAYEKFEIQNLNVKKFYFKNWNLIFILQIEQIKNHIKFLFWSLL